MELFEFLYKSVSFYYTDENLNQWAISFTSGLISTLIGVIIGLPIALLINRLIENRKCRSEKLLISRTILSSISKNKNLLEQLSAELNQNTMPFYSLDIVVLESLSKEYHSFLKTDLSNSIDYCRYELTHISRKIDHLFSHYDHLITGSMQGNGFRILKTSIILHLNTLLPKVKELELELQNEINGTRRINKKYIADNTKDRNASE